MKTKVNKFFKCGNKKNKKFSKTYEKYLTKESD
jgi:hypothetical protein